MKARIVDPYEALTLIIEEVKGLASLVEEIGHGDFDNGSHVVTGLGYVGRIIDQKMDALEAHAEALWSEAGPAKGSRRC